MKKNVRDRKIADKLADLQKDVLAWAKAEGIAEYVDQVPVTLRYVERPLRFSTELTASDWKKIRSRRFGWNRDDKYLLRLLQDTSTVEWSRFDPQVQRINARLGLFKSGFRIRTKKMISRGNDQWELQMAKRLN